MAPQYIPLTPLHDASESLYAAPRFLRAYRLSRRWLYIFFLFCIILLLLAFLVPRSSLKPQPSSQFIQSNRSSFPPLLGSEECPTKLWYPAKGNSFQPGVASYNALPSTKERLRTPLFVGFTRNNEMLKQTILSYIAAGWPREDIIIVDNGGTLDANSEGLLSSDNPFFLDYKLFRSRYGVSILQTHTLLSFAQLMNFYLRISIAQRWQFFFWSHMDVVILSDEAAVPYKSFYHRVLDILDEAGLNKRDRADTEGRKAEKTWAVKFFSYDWLTLVNVEPWRTIGQWDTFIPYYTCDCDAYSRVTLNGFTKDEANAGRIFDLADVIAEPESKFFPSATHSTKDSGSSDGVGGSAHPDLLLNSLRYQTLLHELETLQSNKKSTDRNQWQGHGKGGRGEPWTYDPEGFQKMWWATADNGRVLYKKKWGQDECRLDEHGASLSELWKSGNQ